MPLDTRPPGTLIAMIILSHTTFKVCFSLPAFLGLQLPLLTPPSLVQHTLSDPEDLGLSWGRAR